MTVRASILLLLMLVGCGDGGGTNGGEVGIPAAAELVGTYDLTTRCDDSVESELGVGWVSAEESLHVALTIPAVAVAGELERDGTVSFEGHTTNSDAITPVRGAARVETESGVLHITGTVDSPRACEFTMERPIESDQSSASGRYRLTFVRSPAGASAPLLSTSSSPS